MSSNPSGSTFATLNHDSGVRVWSYKHYQPVSKVVTSGEDPRSENTENSKTGRAGDMGDLAAFSLIDKYLTRGR